MEGTAFTYLEHGPQEGEELLWSYDLESGERRLLCSAGALGSFTRGNRKALSGYRWCPDGRALLLPRKKELWRWDLSGKPERLLAQHDPQVPPQFSPDG